METDKLNSVPSPIEHVNISPASALDTDILLTVTEVARYLRVQPSTVRSMAKRGDLPAMKVGRSWRFRARHVKQWLYQVESGAVQP